MRSPVEEPSRVGGFEIVRALGRGGMAQVDLVRPTEPRDTHQRYALKRLLPHLAKNSEQIGLFRDEIRVASAIDHPNVVRVIAHGEEDGQPYMVMAFLAGEPLSTISAGLATERESCVGFWCSVLAQAAAGLQGAHGACDEHGKPLDIVHRDISPDNIHVGDDGIVRIVDFGIAQANNRRTTTRSGYLRGKYEYLAPEAIAGGVSIDRRADIWSLGVVAWELFTGTALFRGESTATTLWNVLHLEVPPLQEKAPWAPSEVIACVHRMLERALDQREPDLGGFITACRNAAEALGQDPEKVDPPVLLVESAPTSQAAIGEDAPTVRSMDAAQIPPHLVPTSLEPTDTPWISFPKVETREVSQDGSETTLETSEFSTTAVLVKAIPPGQWDIDELVSFLRPWIPWVAATFIASLLLTIALWPSGPQAPKLAPAATTMDIPPPVTMVQIDVDPSIRLVFVDGARRDERPLRIAIRHGSRARVAYLLSSGRLVERDIGPEAGDAPLKIP